MPSDRRKGIRQYLGPGDGVDDLLPSPWGFLWGMLRVAGIIALTLLVADLVDFGDGIVGIAGRLVLLVALTICWAAVEVASVKLVKQRHGR